MVVENDEASLAEVKDFLKEALVLDLDTEEFGNPVQANSISVSLDGLIEKKADDDEFSVV